MPELPEVERAAGVLRAAIVGKTITKVKTLHPALGRRVSSARLRALAGRAVTGVARRGKHQFIELDDGRRIHVHFRMTGDWTVDTTDAPLPRFARAVIELADRTRVVLDDPRALSTIDVHAAGANPLLDLGPEPGDTAFTADAFMSSLGRRRGPIKPVLLDQRVVAGLGNIYAAEALWRARISPTARANALDRKRIATLITAVRKVIDRASGALYRTASANRFDVYDREGQPCRRCRTPIRRITQAGRSTYYCPHCQSR